MSLSKTRELLNVFLSYFNNSLKNYAFKRKSQLKNLNSFKHIFYGKIKMVASTHFPFTNAKNDDCNVVAYVGYNSLIASTYFFPQCDNLQFLAFI